MQVSQSIPPKILPALKQSINLWKFAPLGQKFLLSDMLFINSLLIVYMCQMNIILTDPMSEIFTTFNLRMSVPLIPLTSPQRKWSYFDIQTYPSEEYNYSEDTTTLYEMWYTVLRATLKKLIIVAIMCLTQFTQLCDWQKLPKQNSIKYNFDSHKTSLPLL